MFFLKKLVSQFFTPLSLTLELMLLGLILLYFTSKQKTGKILVLTGVAVLILCSYTPTADFFIESLKKQYPHYLHASASSPGSHPTVVAVLGSGHNRDMSQPALSRLGYDSLMRLIEGIRIYRTIPDGKLLLSGGASKGSDPTAEVMAQLARDLGVDDDDIILETDSQDTKDEARIIYSMLGDAEFILVTSASHMPRSMALFTKLGMKPVPASTKSIERELLYRTPNPLFPSSINIQKVELAFHEYLGIIWAKMRGQI